MRISVGRNAFLALAIAGGAVGFFLRWQAYRTCMGPDGLLAPSGWQTALVALSLAAAAVLALLARYSRFPKDYHDLYPASAPAAGLGWCSAGLLCIGCVLQLLRGGAWTYTAVSVLGLLAAAALTNTARKRKQGRRPEYLLQGMVCLFFLLTLMHEFYHRGHDPQLLDNVFQLLSWLCLMLSAFYRTCLDIQTQQTRLLAFVNGCGIFCTMVALSAGENLLLHLGALVWALQNQPREAQG
jgi:hypothetical protein